MSQKKLKILAVNDPAVVGYQELGIISNYVQKFGQQVNFDIVDFKDYGEKYQRVLLGQEHYDIFMVAGHLWLPELLEKRLIIPLKIKTFDIFPSIIEEITFNRQPFLAPSFCDGHIFVYRKSDFQKAKLSLPEGEVKISDILKWATKLSNYGKDPIAMKGHPSELFLDVLPFIRSTGQEPVNQLGEFINEPSLLNEGLEKYEKLLLLGDTKSREYGNEEIKNTIQKNTASMAITWNGQLGQVYNENCQQKEDLGFANLEQAWNVTWGFAIHKNTQQEAQAQHFLAYLISYNQANQIGCYSGAPIYQRSLKENSENYPWYKAHNFLLNHAKRLPNVLKLNETMAHATDYYLDYFSSHIVRERRDS